MPTHAAQRGPTIAPQSRVHFEYVDPRSLNFADYNPRKMDPEKRAKLKHSLQKHGFVDPVVARIEDKLIVGGHQRTDVAMHDLGMTLVPVVFVTGMSDAQAKALNIALNNKELQGMYDMPKLKELVADLMGLDDFDIGLTGFSDEQAIEIANWQPPQLVPATTVQQQPVLKGEVLIEIRGARATLEPLLAQIAQFSEDHPTVDVTIT